MRFLKIVARRCIGSWRQEASQMLCCGWLTIGYNGINPTIDSANADRRQNTHQQVKTKILERMEEWTKEFSKDPDLGIMEQAYMRLKTQSTARPMEPCMSSLLTVY